MDSNTDLVTTPEWLTQNYIQETLRKYHNDLKLKVRMEFMFKCASLIIVQ